MAFAFLGKINGIGDGGCLGLKERYPGSMSRNNFTRGEWIIAFKTVIQNCHPSMTLVS
jgi:hypothetical protein